MTTKEFNKRLKEYIGEREMAFYWEEVPKTLIWHDTETNRLCSNLGVSVDCDEYDCVCECVNDLLDAVADYYAMNGIIVHETVN